MTKTSTNRNLIAEHLDLYKHAVIWDTRFDSQFDSYDTPEEKKEKEIDIYRRDVQTNIRCSEHEAHCQCQPHFKVEDSEQISKVWDYFSRQTTFHGVKFIPCHERHRPSRLVWLLIVLTMASALMYTVGSLLAEYYQYNTVTRTEVEVTTTPVFPSITFCNNCPYVNVDKLHNSTLFKLIAYDVIKTPLFYVNLSDPDVISFLSQSEAEAQEAHSYTADDMFFLASYEKRPLNVTETFEILETSQGRCFTFNGPNYIAKNGPMLATHDGRESGLKVYLNISQDKYYIYKDITAGVRIYVTHHPETPRLQKDGVDIHPGTSTRLALSPVQYTFLPPPYKSYGTENCEKKGPEKSLDKMLNASFYSYENCLEQCRIYRASVACSCYTSLLYVADLQQCSLGETLFCFKAILGNTTAEGCDCPRPCDFTRYDIRMSASQMPSKIAGNLLARLVNRSNAADLREDFMEIRVYLDTMLLRHEQHEPQYTFNSIFAFLGGQMGFFMGASLITLGELIETILFSFYVFVHKKLKTMGRLMTSAGITPVKPAWK